MPRARTSYCPLALWGKRRERNGESLAEAVAFPEREMRSSAETPYEENWQKTKALLPPNFTLLRPCNLLAVPTT